MAHTVVKEIYSEELKKYIKCEVLVMDEEENIPRTDRREVLLYCQGENMTDDRYEDYDESVMDTYPETALIEQYVEFNVDRD